MKKLALGCLLVLTVAACAKQPSSIEAVSMNNTYVSVSCSQAKKLYMTERAKVPTLVTSQKQAVAGDAIGVFLIGLPVSSLSGEDREDEIAETKGKLSALAARLDSCGLPQTVIGWG